MKKKFNDKSITPKNSPEIKDKEFGETEPEPKVGEKIKFWFPDQNITIEASSIEEAYNIIKKLKK